MAGGTVYESVETVYPARTVVCFSSMFTGAAPEVHGITSNLVLKLGLKVESVFDVLRRVGKKGRLVGIAHLIDAFGDDVASVTSVAHNDKIDQNLIAAARRELEEHDPELARSAAARRRPERPRQGHLLPRVRGAHRDHRPPHRGLHGPGARSAGYLEDAAVILMADHGQGRGIGAHGHLSEGERFVPFAMWGSGVVGGRRWREIPASILDLAPTICYLLGVEPPEGLDRAGPRGGARGPGGRMRPLAVVIPAKDEEATIGELLDRISAHPRAGPRDCVPIVVDDGSTDADGKHRPRRVGAVVVGTPGEPGARGGGAHGVAGGGRRRRARRRLPRRRPRVLPGGHSRGCSSPCSPAGRTTCSGAAFSAPTGRGG